MVSFRLIGQQDAHLLSDAGKEVTYQLPRAAVEQFPKLFADLEEKRQQLKISHYGVSITTLEQVFLRIAEVILSSSSSFFFWSMSPFTQLQEGDKWEDDKKLGASLEQRRKMKEEEEQEEGEDFNEVADKGTKSPSVQGTSSLSFYILCPTPSERRSSSDGQK